MENLNTLKHHIFFVIRSNGFFFQGLKNYKLKNKTKIRFSFSSLLAVVIKTISLAECCFTEIIQVHVHNASQFLIQTIFFSLSQPQATDLIPNSE